MPALIGILLRSGATLLFSSAAVISSIGFLNKTNQPAPVQTGISQFQIGQLAVAVFAVFMGYKLLKAVIK